MILDLEYQYVDIVKNNALQISNMVMHIWIWICTHYFHINIRWCFENIITMWHDKFLYVSNCWLYISLDLLFFALNIWSIIFFKKCSRHDNNDECIIFADMQHWQVHINLHWEVVFLIWCYRMLCKVESLMMILLSAYLSSLITTYYGVLNILLFSSLTEAFNNNFGDNFLVTINGDVKKIICYWVLHNLRIIYNPFVKVLFDLLINFCMTMALRNNWPQSIELYNFLASWFGIT